MNTTGQRRRPSSPMPTPLLAALRAACDPRRQRDLAGYFGRAAGTAGPFPGLTAVAARRVARRFAPRLRQSQVRALLASRVDEHRFVALQMLVRDYQAGGSADRERIAKLYLRNLRHVDHWVLVDTSAPYIVGDHLKDRSRRILFQLAGSKDFVRRRLAILATLAFIRAGDFADTLRLAAALLRDEHPLVQRAVGWMLREVGKRAPATLARFLRNHAGQMPRLMLRYAIESFPARARAKYLVTGSVASLSKDKKRGTRNEGDRHEAR